MATALCVTSCPALTSFAENAQYTSSNQKTEISALQEYFPYGYYDLFARNYENIPDYVMEYQKKLGGMTIFTTDILSNNDNILGLYHADTNNIEIRLHPNYIQLYGSELYSVAAHEYGHFIFNITRSNGCWTERMNKTMEQEFKSRSSMDTRCVNCDETFAYAYADYVTAPERVNQGMKETIEICLKNIAKLNAGIRM